ncbi:MAG: hypothetical protein KGJ59_12570, partial [Bacteroidota bacterium]|nr:hypothetical protein [Bacteroidota bacterium]
MSDKKISHWTSDADLVEQFLLRRLDSKKISECGMHLYDCEQCRRIVEQEAELIAGIRRFGRREIKKSLRARLKNEEGFSLAWTQIVSVAAAVFLILIGAAIYKLWVEPEQEGSM